MLRFILDGVGAKDGDLATLKKLSELVLSEVRLSSAGIDSQKEKWGKVIPLVVPPNVLDQHSINPYTGKGAIEYLVHHCGEPEENFPTLRRLEDLHRDDAKSDEAQIRPPPSAPTVVVDAVEMDTKASPQKGVHKEPPSSASGERMSNSLSPSPPFMSACPIKQVAPSMLGFLISCGSTLSSHELPTLGQLAALFTSEDRKGGGEPPLGPAEGPVGNPTSPKKAPAAQTAATSPHAALPRIAAPPLTQGGRGRGGPERKRPGRAAGAPVTFLRQNPSTLIWRPHVVGGGPSPAPALVSSALPRAVGCVPPLPRRLSSREGDMGVGGQAGPREISVEHREMPGGDANGGASSRPWARPCGFSLLSMPAPLVCDTAHVCESEPPLRTPLLDYYTSSYLHPGEKLPTLRSTSVPLGGSKPSLKNKAKIPHPVAFNPPGVKVIKAIKSGILASNPWDDLKIVGTQVYMPPREVVRKSYRHN